MLVHEARATTGLAWNKVCKAVTCAPVTWHSTCVHTYAIPRADRVTTFYGGDRTRYLWRWTAVVCYTPISRRYSVYQRTQYDTRSGTARRNADFNVETETAGKINYANYTKQITIQQLRGGDGRRTMGGERPIVTGTRKQNDRVF